MNKEVQSKKLVSMPRAKVVRVQPIERTTRGLRSMLFEEIDSFRAGRTGHQELKALGSAVNPILASFKLELDAERFTPKGKGANGSKSHRVTYAVPHLQLD